MAKREYTIPKHNETIGAYKLIAQLMKDPEFDIKEPMTDTYLMEVGYELGWRDETTRRVINLLYAQELLS